MLSPVIGEMPVLDASEDNVTETDTKTTFDYKETQPTADKHQQSAGTLIILFLLLPRFATTPYRNYLHKNCQ